MKKKPDSPQEKRERRTSARTLIDDYYSVQFAIHKEVPTYQFKLRNISKDGLCIAVRQDSALLEHLKVGEIHRMRYAPLNTPGQLNDIYTAIRHVTLCREGPYKDHYLVGLSITDYEKPG